jgi:hypothetical protein
MSLNRFGGLITGTFNPLTDQKTATVEYLVVAGGGGGGAAATNSNGAGGGGHHRGIGANGTDGHGASGAGIGNDHGIVVTAAVGDEIGIAQSGIIQNRHRARDADGGLIGGASLKAPDFLAIVQAAQ